MKTYIFKSTSKTNGYPGFKERDGEVVTIEALLESADYEDNLESIYKIKFLDGVETEAFSGEVV